MNFWPYIIIALLIVNIICIISVVFMERKHPQTTVSWVLVMTFVPLIGPLLYLFVGKTFVLRFEHDMKKRMVFHRIYSDMFYDQLKLLDKDRLLSARPEIKQYSGMIKMLLSQNNSIYTDDNKIKIFVSATQKYHQLFEDIKNAKSTIHIEYFIIKNDEDGQMLVSLLAKKASEGVSVRLIYDEFGSLKTTMKFFKPIIDNGGQVYRFFKSRFKNILRINHRFHRKIVIIDGRIAYTGGMNIGIEYEGKNPKFTPWRDTHLRIEGSAVYMLQIRFLLDWALTSGEDFNENMASLQTFFPDFETNGKLGMQIVASGPDTVNQKSAGEDIKYGYLKIINGAKHRLYIQTPYFIPDDSILEALKLSAASGVDIRVMLPGIPDKKFVYGITCSYAEELLKMGIRVYLYNGFIHSKTMVADSGVTSIGTANVDIRSFALNFEVNTFVYDSEFAEKNVRIFMNDLKDCTELNMEEYKKRKIKSKLFESIVRLLSPLA